MYKLVSQAVTTAQGSALCFEGGAGGRGGGRRPARSSALRSFIVIRSFNAFLYTVRSVSHPSGRPRSHR